MFVVVSVSRSGSSQPVLSTLQISIISWAARDNGRNSRPDLELDVGRDRQQADGSSNRVGGNLPDRLDPDTEQEYNQ